MNEDSVCFDNASIRAKIQSGELRVVDKRSRSRVWNVFSRVVDKNGMELNNVVCRTCPSVFKFHGSTSNLVRHKCYKTAVEDLDLTDSMMQNKKFRYSLDEQDSSRDTSYAADKMSISLPIQDLKQRVVEAFSDWIVDACRSLNIIGDAGLRKLLEIFMEIGDQFGRQFRVNELIPEEETIFSTIEGNYQEALTKLRTEVSAARRNGYSLTCTCLIDSYTKDMNLSVTMHYVKDGSLVSHLLTVSTLNESAARDLTLNTKIENVLRWFECEWYDDKPIYVTSIDETNALGEDQIYCISQLLSNVIEFAFNDVNELKEMLIQANDLITFLLTLVESNLTKQLVCYNPRQKNSIFYVLKSIEIHWSDILKVCDDERALEQMGNLNLDNISTVVHILGQFEKSMKILEDDKSPTLHLVIPHVHRLRKLCNTASNTELEAKLKLKLKDQLEILAQYHIGKQHRMAMYLFPPTNQLLQCNELEKEQTIEECKKLMKKFSKSNNQNNGGDVEVKKEPTDDDLFSDFVGSRKTKDRIAREIRRYEDIEVPLINDFDVLYWWHTNIHNFPLLSRVSSIVLSAPASSVPSAKALDKARKIFADSNQNMAINRDLANKILFVNSN